MSKRFGRNQKRKMRVRIESLEHREVYLKRALLSSNQERSALEYRLSELVNDFNRWWRYSVLTDPKTMKVDHELPPRYRIPIDKHSYPPCGFNASPGTCVDEFLAEMLYALKVAVKRDLGTRHCHIILSNKTEHAYYISDDSFNMFRGFTSQAKKHLIENLIREFERLYNK